ARRSRAGILCFTTTTYASGSNGASALSSTIPALINALRARASAALARTHALATALARSAHSRARRSASRPSKRSIVALARAVVSSKAFTARSCSAVVASVQDSGGRRSLRASVKSNVGPVSCSWSSSFSSAHGASLGACTARSSSCASIARSRSRARGHESRASSSTARH
ncbi:hypothetical protein BE221DRAFT_8892, partial [Ostreococcus tauri]